MIAAGARAAAGDAIRDVGVVAGVVIWMMMWIFDVRSREAPSYIC